MTCRRQKSGNVSRSVRGKIPACLAQGVLRRKCTGVRMRVAARGGIVQAFSVLAPFGRHFLCISAARCHLAFVACAFLTCPATSFLPAMHFWRTVPWVLLRPCISDVRCHGPPASRDAVGARSRPSALTSKRYIRYIIGISSISPGERCHARHAQRSLHMLAAPAGANPRRSAARADASSRTSRAWMPDDAPWRDAARASFCGP